MRLTGQNNMMKSNPNEMEQVNHESKFRISSPTPTNTLAAVPEYGLGLEF